MIHNYEQQIVSIHMTIVQFIRMWPVLTTDICTHIIHQINELSTIDVISHTFLLCHWTSLFWSAFVNCNILYTIWSYCWVYKSPCLSRYIFHAWEKTLLSFDTNSEGAFKQVELLFKIIQHHMSLIHSLNNLRVVLLYESSNTIQKYLKMYRTIFTKKELLLL